MDYERRHEHLPFGPLTREDFSMLAGSFYDGGGPRGSMLDVANQRGITRGNFVRLHMVEAGFKVPNVSRPDLGGSGAGQTGIELPD